MPTRPMKTLALLVCAALSTLAQGADLPARVGRVAIAQGPVSIAPEFGAEQAAAQVNWPVTTGNLITTAAGARTELRIGSTSIRLDGDSSLEIIELDDDTVRVRLHYGSASLRAVDPDTLAGFTLETPQVRVRLEQPGRVRVDAERVRDTSAVNVFEGVALVEGGASELTVRAGRRAEISDEDVRTLAALRDPFDDWAYQRDRYQDGATSVRYVGSDMTGYEDLDRYGNWSTNNDYGPLWYPSVASGWVPYRDGSWAWVEPWGWTWVDNAPWGYAPFHYGRWVNVHNRWAWAPGRHVGHPVWAPALVGWVGGNNWNVAFHDRQRHPALGWYPLAPWDRYEPGYHAPESHLRWWNGAVRPNGRPHDYRPQGLTVVPQDRFNRPGRINVPRAPIATVPPVLAHNLPAGAPPAPLAQAGFQHQPHHDGQPGRVIGNVPPGTMQPGRWDHHGPGGAARLDTDRVARDGINLRGPQLGLPVTSPTPHLPPQPLPVTSPTPHLPPQPLTVTSPTPQQGMQQPIVQGEPRHGAGNPWAGREHPWRDRDDRDGRDGRDGRDQGGEWRRNRMQPQPMQPSQPMQAAQAPQVPQAPQAAMLGVPPVTAHHGGWERREAPAAASPRPAMPQAPMMAPPREVAREMARPAPPMAMPAPQPAPQPAAQPAPAARPAEAHQRNEPRAAHHQER